MRILSRGAVTAPLALLAGTGQAATLDSLTEDGLYTWRVAAVDGVALVVVC